MNGTRGMVLWRPKMVIAQWNRPYVLDVHWYEKDGIQYETKLKYRKENVR